MAVDGARFLLKKSRQSMKGIKYLDLKNNLISLSDDWRAHLNRRLQYFINALLVPWVGCGKTRVKLNFDHPMIQSRDFTVNVRPKERRAMMGSSRQCIKSLK